MDLLQIWLIFILFLAGISVGSFINAFEYRLFTKKDFVKARSHCPKCKHTLKAIDLIPLLSFVLIRGKCRYCGTKVSWQYPIIEFLSGTLFLASGCYVLSRMHIQGVSDTLLMLSISTFLAIILDLFLFFALYDVKHKIVPNKVVVPSIVIALLFNLLFALGMHLAPNLVFWTVWGEFNVLWNMLSAILGGFFIIFIIYITKGRGMGGGDLKLIVFMGLILGWKKLLLAFYIAVITGSIVGIIWGIYKRKLRGLKLPFALFLAIGSIFAILWGDYLFDTYFGMIGVYR
ncbi:prepilin peptidase [Patescibacteria group bacterium]